MNRSSFQPRDFIVVVLLLLLLLLAFPLLSSLFASRVPALPTPTPTSQSVRAPIVTYLPTAHQKRCSV